MDIESIKGTDINYYFICRRRTWMSVHSFYIIDKNQFVQHGSFLSAKKRNTGYNSVRIGKNEIDNLEQNSNGEYIVHEYKRGYKPLDGDIFQILHYMNLIENSGYKIGDGILHLLGSKKVVYVKKTEKLMNRLIDAYRDIQRLKNEEMPGPIRNYFCLHGCSYAYFCWG